MKKSSKKNMMLYVLICLISFFTIPGFSKDGWACSEIPESPWIAKVAAAASAESSAECSSIAVAASGTGLYESVYKRKVVNPSLPYYLYFEKGTYTISVYGRDNKGYYSKLVKTISSSRGRTLHMTPTGTFKLAKQNRWYQFRIGLYWTQYCIRYANDMYLHGPLYKKRAGNTMYIKEYNQIGTASTAGCLAMATRDIKWIWDNCPDGTTLEIVNGAPVGNKASAPKRIPINGPAIDPTDPAYK